MTIFRVGLLILSTWIAFDFGIWIGRNRSQRGEDMVMTMELLDVTGRRLGSAPVSLQIVNGRLSYRATDIRVTRAYSGPCKYRIHGSGFDVIGSVASPLDVQVGTHARVHPAPIEVRPA